MGYCYKSFLPAFLTRQGQAFGNLPPRKLYARTKRRALPKQAVATGWDLGLVDGDPGLIRTADTQFRKLLLYPSELRGHSPIIAAVWQKPSGQFPLRPSARVPLAARLPAKAIDTRSAVLPVSARRPYSPRARVNWRGIRVTWIESSSNATYPEQEKTLTSPAQFLK